MARRKLWAGGWCRCGRRSGGGSRRGLAGDRRQAEPAAVASGAECRARAARRGRGRRERLGQHSRLSLPQEARQQPRGCGGKPARRRQHGERGRPPQTARASRPRPRATSSVDVYVTGDIAQAEPRAARARDARDRDQRPSRRSAWSRATCRPPHCRRPRRSPRTRAVLSPVVEPQHPGSVLSQGDAAIHGPAGARARRDGSRASQVGIISDSIDKVRGGDRRTRRRRETCPRTVDVPRSTCRAAPTRAARWPRSSTTRPRASAASSSSTGGGGAAGEGEHRSTAS